VALDRAGRLDRRGRDNLLADLDEALVRASAILAGLSSGGKTGEGVSG